MLYKLRAAHLEPELFSFLREVSPPARQLELTEKSGTSQKKQNLLLLRHLKIRPVVLPRKSGKVNSYLAAVTQRALPPSVASAKDAGTDSASEGGSAGGVKDSCNTKTVTKSEAKANKLTA